MVNTKGLNHFRQWADAIPECKECKPKDDPVFFVRLMNFFGTWEVWVRNSKNNEDELCRSYETSNGFSSRDDALIYVGQLRQKYSRFEIQLEEGLGARRLERLDAI